MKPIVIYTWAIPDNDNYNMPTLPEFLNIARINRPHDSSENVKNIARLFAASLPGCDCDMIYTAIASELRNILQSNNGRELLLTEHDIETRIRMIINDLAELDE